MAKSYTIADSVVHGEEHITIHHCFYRKDLEKGYLSKHSENGISQKGLGSDDGLVVAIAFYTLEGERHCSLRDALL